MAQWIDGFGRYKTASEKYEKILASDSVFEHRTDIGWIRDTATLGRELSERLVRLRSADRTAGNRYVSQTYYETYDQWSPNPCFDGEKPYYDLSNPDYGYRLLTVFRFWNMVEYFFPSKYLTDKDWNDVLPEDVYKRQLMLSGASVPREAMPEWLYRFGQILPSSSGVEGFIRIQSMGASFSDVLHEVRILWILTIVYGGFAAVGIHLRLKKAAGK